MGCVNTAKTEQCSESSQDFASCWKSLRTHIYLAVEKKHARAQLMHSNALVGQGSKAASQSTRIVEEGEPGKTKVREVPARSGEGLLHCGGGPEHKLHSLTLAHSHTPDTSTSVRHTRLQASPRRGTPRRSRGVPPSLTLRGASVCDSQLLALYLAARCGLLPI